MPLYEYKCGECGRRETVMHGFNEPAPERCPRCGGEKLTRLFSRFSVAKSEKDRINDLSWIDRDISHRLRKKAGGSLSPEFSDTLDKLEST